MFTVTVTRRIGKAGEKQRLSNSSGTVSWTSDRADDSVGIGHGARWLFRRLYPYVRYYKGQGGEAFCPRERAAEILGRQRDYREGFGHHGIEGSSRCEVRCTSTLKHDEFGYVSLISDDINRA